MCSCCVAFGFKEGDTGCTQDVRTGNPNLMFAVCGMGNEQ